MAGKYSKYGNYDLSPRIKVEGFDREVSEGYDALLAEIKKLME